MNEFEMLVSYIRGKELTQYEAIVKEVLETLRNPSVAMLECGGNVKGMDDLTIGCGPANNCWQAMLNRILENAK